LDNEKTGNEVVIGWDTLLGSYFAQVVKCGGDKPTIWLGRRPGEFTSPERLIDAIGPYAAKFPYESLVTNLRLDKQNNDKRLYSVDDFNVLTASKAFQLLIQATADATDARQQREDEGVIQSWMSNDEAIAVGLAYRVWEGFEEKTSPLVMTSLLVNYCSEDLVDAFVNFLQIVARKDGVSLEASALLDSCIYVLIDIPAFALTGKALGNKETWGQFKEPYATQWRSAFSSS